MHLNCISKIKNIFKTIIILFLSVLLMSSIGTTYDEWLEIDNVSVPTQSLDEILAEVFIFLK